MCWQQYLLNANVLVLYIAGRIDKGLIGSHRQLGEYVEVDFDIPMLVFEYVRKTAKTNNILIK